MERFTRWMADDKTGFAADAAGRPDRLLARRLDEPVPAVARLDTLPTAIFLTEHAPPPATGTVASIPLTRLSDGRAGAGDRALRGHLRLDRQSANGQLGCRCKWTAGEARRVVLRVEAAPRRTTTRAGGRSPAGNDYYIVDTNGVCSAGGDARPSSRICPPGRSSAECRRPSRPVTRTNQQRAGLAVPSHPTAMPAILDEDSFVSIDADLWIAPSLNAVLRYDLTVTTRGVRILSGSEPVSGMLTLRYELDVPSLDARPNISIPNGC